MLVSDETVFDSACTLRGSACLAGRRESSSQAECLTYIKVVFVAAGRH